MSKLEPESKPVSLIRHLNLVRNGSSFYPRDEDDHTLLSSITIPILTLTVDFFPLLEVFCKRKRVKIIVVQFDDMEASMLKAIQARWEHELAITPHSLTFIYLKDSKGVNTTNMVESICKWYAKHNILTEVSVKRTSKAYRLSIKKVGS